MNDNPVLVNDAEVSLLGAAMSGASIDTLADIVKTGDFYRPTHNDIWSAILRVHAAGNQPDAVQVRLAMEADGAKPDGTELFRMTQLVPIIASAPWYAEQVANAAGHRAIAEAGIKLTELGNTFGDLEERREQARQAVDEACATRSGSHLERLADGLPDVLDIAQNGTTKTLPMPWSDLDDLTGGILAPGRVVVIGARPGVGKSLLGTNVALHVAHRHSHAVHVASMEMTKLEVNQRLVAAHARVNLTGLQNGTTDEASWNRIAAATEELQAMPIFIDDTPAQSVQHIRARARDIQRTRDDLAVIVVDYLQLMETAGRSDNRAQELAAVSRGIKLIARETGACVLALAQVNRAAVQRGNDRPRQSDIRESGAIESDADQVILLHQPDDEIPEIEVIVDKNRHGPKGIRSLQVWGHYARLAQVGHWREETA